MGVLISALISYSLMGIDQIASVVEAPFQGYLPVTALWAGLRSDVAYTVGLNVKDLKLPTNLAPYDNEFFKF
jgi:predicted membrane chloride channel (bestrophin family)